MNDTLTQLRDWMAAPQIRMYGTRRLAYELLPKAAVGCECGVLRGDNALDLLGVTEPRTLYLVDDWSHPHCRRETLELLARHVPALQVVTATAAEWLSAQPEGSLDWCYLDTRHWFEDTCSELPAMLHAVRPGGVLAFHDFVIEPGAWRGGVVIPILTAIAERHMRPSAVTNERFPTIFCEKS